MNPIELNRGPADVARYKGEPYVVAADVLSAPGRAGQCGWTWYTGSAAWMYRIWIEEVLGFRLRGDRFTVEPALPADWPGFELAYRHGSTVYEIKVNRHEGESVSLELNGAEVGFIPLEHTGGTHRVTVRLPQPTPVAIAPSHAPEVAVPVS
jgi:cyclic beta-1,2-glucan synthetase